MDFAEGLEQLVARIKNIRDSIATEEATKTSLIMPFFSLLGYDVFNPLEFMPEFTADVGVKKGEKVDYAIINNGEPVVLIEAKAVDKKLNKYDSQLFRYFSVSKAKFAILTNGIQYRFYTDLDETNKMDSLPFLQIDLLNLKDSQIEELKKFCKSSFDATNIADSASLLKQKDTLKQVLSNEFNEPSDELIRYFLPSVYPGMKTQSVVAKFRPILKQALDEYINETMNERIKNALNPSAAAQQPQQVETQAEEVLPIKNELSDIEEIAFNRIRAFFEGYVDLDKITAKKTDNYVAVVCEDSSRKWICRFMITRNQKTIILPDEAKQEIRCRIANLYEMENYKPYLITVLSRYTSLLRPWLQNVKVYTIETKRRFPKHTIPEY